MMMHGLSMSLVILSYIAFVGYIVKTPMQEIFRIDVPVLVTAALFSILLSFIL